jgi:hypothetical protein
MLAYVPDRPENRREVLLNDYEAALAAYGVAGWPPVDDRDALGDVLIGITSTLDPPVLVAPRGFGDQAFDAEAWRTEFGFSIVDSAWDVTSGEAPGTLHIVETNRSAEEIVETIRSDPAWQGDLNEVGTGNAAYVAWLDDPFQVVPERRSPARPLGRGGALAVLDGGITIRSVDPEAVEASLGAAAGAKPSLLDDDSYAAVARALDAAGVYTALLTNENATVDPTFVLGRLGGDGDGDAALPTAEEVQERIDSIATVPPYLALGIGNKIDAAADPQGILVLVFAAQSPEAATATVEGMEDIVANGLSIARELPWSDLVSIRSATTDGSLAIVELQTDNPRIGIDAFYTRDTLFVSG